MPMLQAEISLQFVPPSPSRPAHPVQLAAIEIPASIPVCPSQPACLQAFPAGPARQVSAPRFPMPKRRTQRTTDRSDVLVSAVISTYLLTHLHHVLQRAEYGAQQEGRTALAANYAQLRKVLCLDARSMEDASASGTPVNDSPRAA